MQFKKGRGLTASEKILSELCERSFLRLWTYPNLSKKPGKELADLLVIFRDDLVIFSDKSCAYPDTGDEILDWQRWFRRAIAESAHQIRQAERWLLSQPGRIFLDAKCTQRLPLRLPNSDRCKVHYICVATGASDRCHAATGRTSLAIDINVLDDSEPFTVGRIREIGGWLHVLDGHSLNLLLNELNTINDFVAYLDAKRRLLDDGIFRRAQSEADLLARYLWYGRSFPAVTEPYIISPNLWAQLEANPRFQAGRRENAVSVFWDRLIEYLTEHYLQGTLESGNELEFAEYEELVRIMASESRFHRRVLSKAILERADKAREAKISTLLPSDHSDVVYTLLIGRGARGEDYEEYRADRRRELYLRCVAGKAARPHCRYVIGIALDARGVGGGSEDFIYLDTVAWTDEILAGAAQVREELQYFIPGKMVESRIEEDEYPDA